jgi:hypothetical protein
MGWAQGEVDGEIKRELYGERQRDRRQKERMGGNVEEWRWEYRSRLREGGEE